MTRVHEQTYLPQDLIGISEQRELGLTCARQAMTKELKTHPISEKLLRLKQKTSWSWERMYREFHRVMGEPGPSHTTLFRYSTGEAKRRNRVTERYVWKAIHKTTVELIQKELDESETQRKLVEKELHETELRFRHLVENARDIIFRYRLVPHREFEYVSPAVSDILGYTPAEFYADPDLGLNIVHPDDQHKLKEYMRGQGAEERAVLRYMHKDGRLVWIERVAVPIYDEAGNLVAMEGIMRDVTESKKREEDLRMARAQMEQVINGNPAMTYKCIIDNETFTPVFASKKFHERFGYEEQEYLGNSDWWGSHIHPQDQERVFEQLSTALRDRNAYSHEYRFQHKDGTYRWIQDLFNILRDHEGNPIEIVGAWLDVTSRKRGDS